jgi:hypothetical protein
MTAAKTNDRDGVLSPPPFEGGILYFRISLFREASFFDARVSRFLSTFVFPPRFPGPTKSHFFASERRSDQ